MYAKKIVPALIKDEIKHWLSPLRYLRNAIITCFQFLTKSFPPKYQVDSVPIMKSFNKYETLFQNSERSFKKTIQPYLNECRWFFGRIYNEHFVSIDSELYYSMIRMHRPRRIIEVGSGNSTYFAMEAFKRNAKGRLISIDPSPRRRLPRNVEHLSMCVEHVDLRIFEQLEPNDMLFIDSSHSTVEALYHCNHILPVLRTGVIVHHHDVLYPYVVYRKDDPVNYGEPDVVLDFYQINQHVFEVLIGAAYVRHVHHELVDRLIKSYRWNPKKIPSSLWTRKISDQKLKQITR